MNWTESIYWLTRLDSFKTMIDIFIFVFIVCTLAMLVYRGMSFIEGEEYKKRPLLLGTFISLSALFILLKVFVPTTKEAIFIISAGKTLNYVSTDTTIQKIPQKVSEITVNWLDQKLNEIKTEVKKDIVK